MGFETIKVGMEGHLAVISMNRPQAMNALSTQMAKDLLSVMQELTEERNVFAALLKAEGDRAFCVGADLKERKSMSHDDMKSQRALFVRMFKAVADFPKPMVAVVQGFALGGGCELALACDFIIAAEEAVFGLPEVGLAIIPGGGGTQLLPRVIGRNLAKELIFTGRKIPAAKAKELGLVNHLTTASELEGKSREIAAEIIKNGPIALRQAKRSINLGVELDLNTAFALEAECYNVCLSTADRDEGLLAFNEKRKPEYQGR